MKETELKPCPFCGGLASINFDPEGIKDTVGRHWAYTVVCDRCCATSGLWFSSEMSAEYWNRRVDEKEDIELSELHAAISDYYSKYGRRSDNEQRETD